MGLVKRSKNLVRRERLKLRKQSNQAPDNKDPADKTVSSIIDPPQDIPSKDNTHDTNTNAHNTALLLSRRPSLPQSGTVQNDGLDDKSDELDSPLREQFANVFTRFQDLTDTTKGEEMPDTLVYKNSSGSGTDSDSSDNGSSEDEQPLSKRQWRLQNKVSLAALKVATRVPNIVEWCDADAPDPFLLVLLKSQPNVVPVPSHWSAKRDYLSSRRGYEKPPFELPKFIRDTGIQEMRNGIDDQTLRQLQRDRVQPKMGRLDIDYQKLHDAFFKHQTPPLLLGFGQVYFEGRELGDVNETLVANIKPGVLSKQLRAALGMPEHDTRVPPPWIQVMQQHGKSPGYRNMIIPGVDQEYNNEGYYDKNLVNKNVKAADHWGQLQEFDLEEDQESDHQQDEGAALSEHEQDDLPTEPIPVSEKVSITEYGRSTDFNAKPSAYTGPDRPLYTILDESSAADRGGIMADKLTYKIEQNEPRLVQEPENKATERPKTRTFKF